MSEAERRPRCQGCGWEYEPDCCWCGEVIDRGSCGNHPGHSTVPMGCHCCMAGGPWTPEAMKKRLRDAEARAENLRRLADERAHEAGVYARRMEQAQAARDKALARADRAERERAEAEARAEDCAAMYRNACDRAVRAERERDETRELLGRLLSTLHRSN